MTRGELLLAAWVTFLAVLLLGPALLPGYLLTYDMVWVPDLALTRDALGVGTSLPRAVPSDAVVAVADEIVPGMLLQKVVLVGALVTGAIGVARLLPVAARAGRVVAATLWVWNPLVVERLVMGHWPLLLALAASPWLVAAVRDWGGRFPPARTWWLVPLASLAASSGLTTAVLLLSLAARRGRLRVLVLLLGAANAPWVAAGLLHAGAATTDPAAASRFALSDEGAVPGPLAALTLGGIWNSEVVPDGRVGLLGWVVPLVLLPLALAGLRPLLTDLGRRTWAALLVCWGVGWVGASLTWAVPEVVGAVAATVPGGGVLRDGGRLLVLCAPLLCLAVGRGAQAVVDAVPAPARTGVRVGLVAAPLALLPGVALGAGAGLRAVPFPEGYAEARSVLRADEGAGDAVLLPFSSYRAPTWNGGRKVLDPTGRYLGVDVVADDVLVVGGEELLGEDPRARRVREALGQDDPAARAVALASLGVSAVVTEPDAGAAPDVAAPTLVPGPDLVVQRLPGTARPSAVPGWWWAAQGGAWAAYAAGLAVPLGGAVRNRSRARD